MPTPIAPRIILAQNARADLQTLLRAHSTPQSLALRARVVLRAADFATPTTLKISRDLGCDNRTAGKWRRRYLALGSCAIRPSAGHGANNARDGPAFARVPSDLNGYSMRHDLTIDKRRLDLSWIYETLY